MSLQHRSTQRSPRSLVSGETSMRLQGGALVLARGVWIAWAAGVLVIFFATLPANFVYLHTVLTTGTSFNNAQIGQVTPNGLRQLQALGLSVNFYATYIIISRVIFVMVWFAVGCIIFWRKSAERMALIASFALVTFPVAFSGTITIAALPPAWWLPLQSMQFLGGLGLSIFFYIFPSGKFVPRWTPWLLIGWVIEESSVSFLSTTSFASLVRSFIDTLLYITLLGSIVAVQVYRYRKVSNQIQRQQTKWVVFGTVVALSGIITTIIVATKLFPADSQFKPLSSLIGNTLLYLFLLLIPLSIGFAILRSRLWEIDIIINRSLVYGSLTVSLAIIYAGSVLALQTLLGTFMQGNQFAIIGSTLLIAVLFQPLRHRIQAIIDRRFYRRKYDAAKTLEAFSATLRSEVDLSQLREHLLNVVQETMEPAHVSLWLRRTDSER